MNGKKITVLTIGTVFMIGLGKSLVVDEQFPPPKFFFATGFAAFALSAASDINPKLAGSFSLLVLTVVVMEEGMPLLQALDGGTSRPRTRTRIRRHR